MHKQRTPFRAGFIKGMKDIGGQSYDRAETARMHTDAYTLGYAAAREHFDGHVTPLSDRAYDCGLVDEYDGYYGQSDWRHPSP